MKRSTQWAVCAVILFAASAAIGVVGLVVISGGGLLILIFLIMGAGALVASNRFRKLERSTSRPGDGSISADLPRPQNPEVRHDRAFNRIAMARREAEVLASSGVDVASARNLIAQAQGAFDTEDYDHAYESAQSAHEVLVAARRTRPLPSVR